jgi:uncharacterized protein (TIGR02246 family)
MTVPAPVTLAARIAVALALLSAADVAATAVPHVAATAIDPCVVIDAVLSAWNRTDSHAIAAQYEADGDFVSPTGDHAIGRRAIEAFYRAAFEAGYSGSAATATAAQVRTLPTGFALIDGYWTIQPTAASRITEPESGLFFALLHRHNGRWWISALREQTSARALRELNVQPVRYRERSDSKKLCVSRSR